MHFNMAADSSVSSSFTPKSVKFDHNSTPQRSTYKQGRPFKATQFWNEAVDNLKAHIELKRKRMRKKWHDQCFTGCDAVDVVLQHLLNEQQNMQNKDVTREKAVKFCQLMLENHVFEAVHQKPLKEDKDNSRCSQFEDSSTKLYRFFEDVAKENLYSRDALDSSDCDLEDVEENKYENSRHCGQDDHDVTFDMAEQGQLQQGVADVTVQVKKCSVMSLKKIMTPAKLFKKTSPKRNHETPCYSNKNGSVEEIWREVALANLLTLVDIPLLDQILSYDHWTESKCPAVGGQSLVFSNEALKRCDSVSSVLSDNSSIRSVDLWMEVALDCLECLPNGIDMLHQAQLEETDTTSRLRLFQSVSDYYNALPEPLWSEKFSDLHVALLNLLMQFKTCEVLKALQLSVILLPVRIREEVVRLLVFMKFVCEDSLRLSSSDSNRNVIEKTLSSCVIRNKVLAPHQCGQLVLFMMDHAEQLKTCPEDVEDQVLARLAGGQPEEVKTEVTYCTRVSQDEYKKQSKDLTEQMLVDVINAVIDDTRIQLKEKKHKLKLFHKHHTALFEKHFSNLL